MQKLQVKYEIISILDHLENRDLNGFYYSLYIDGVNIVEFSKHAQLNFEEIRNILNDYNSIENYHLSLRNYTIDDSKKYNKYFYDVDFTFYTKNKILLFYNSNNLNSNNINSNNEYLIVSDISKLFEIYNEYNHCSKRLYDMINS